MLMQKQRPISYFSIGLIDRKQIKPIYERELMAIVMSVQKRKHYLMGRKFTVHTDQKSFKFLLDQRDILMGYQKWLTKLLGYEFEIIYKAGVENKVADGLSRIVIKKSFGCIELLSALTSTSTLQMQDIFEEVDNDETIAQQLQDMVEGKSEKLGYAIKRGRLFYKDRLVLPKNSKNVVVILKDYHDGVSGVIQEF